MATTKYCEDADLINIRPNILELGVASWDTQSIDAFDIINRTLIAKWYKNVALEHDIVDWRTTPFDPDRVDEEQVKRMACYKTLELAYMHLMKDSSTADGFERETDFFRDRYNEELTIILGLGVNYDWDADDTISDDEKYEPQIRRLVRT